MKVRLNPSYPRQTCYVMGKHFRDGVADINPAVAGAPGFARLMYEQVGEVEIDGVWYGKQGKPIPVQTPAPKKRSKKTKTPTTPQTGDLLDMPEEWRAKLATKVSTAGDLIKLRQASVMGILKAKKVQVKDLFDRAAAQPHLLISKG